MVSVLGSTCAAASWVCRWNHLTKNRPGVYAIDARSEVTMIRREEDEYGDEQRDEDEELEAESEVERDEREVKIKREQIMNR